MSSSEWREVKVSEIGKIVTGKTPKTAISENYGGNIPFLTPSDDMNIKKVKSTARTLSEMGLNSVKNCLLPAKSICVSCIGSDLGKVVLTSEPTVTNQQINSIVPDEKFDPDFIYYGMTILGKHLNYLSKTSTAVPIINKTTFSNFSIIVPSIEEQKSIAHILSTVDDKIEVNNQINRTLENMAQAIFKQWFVDFEFPNEDGEPYKSSGGEMVESELGMIPKGWRVDSLGNLLDVQKGLSYKGKHLVEEGVPMINLGTINPGGGYRQEKIKFYNGDFKDRHMVKPGDLVIANTDMTQDRVILGSPCLVPDFECEKIIFTHHIFAIRNLKIPRNFLYYYFKSKDFRERAEGYATGTTVLALPQKGVVGIDLYLPNVDILKRFNELIQSFIDKMNNFDKENELLKRIRDVLLPKLMSGEIRVSLDEEGDAS
ncbi:restriction endonuclease subunit S [Fusibacter tunisiensis]|uniref:Type I restriction enzyme S subunit n=1 Tax=Fusibacter tunisiensis TaxID=1008308 RepID=A0ABS2MPX4_9FIRM|nr:restriction endonuclease subunit S [Fusibacter tunisiensis]MBM7561451.1 type I restriction enzyme S subunit [Fusibacter tunisiensis]